MTDATRLLIRILGGLTLAAMLMLPTIVGAMAEPFPAAAEDPEGNPCGTDEHDAETHTLDPEPQTVSACLELMPEQSTPLDETDLPSAQETRAALPERRRAEAV